MLWNYKSIKLDQVTEFDKEFVNIVNRKYLQLKSTNSIAKKKLKARKKRWKIASLFLFFDDQKKNCETAKKIFIQAENNSKQMQLKRKHWNHSIIVTS